MITSVERKNSSPMWESSKHLLYHASLGIKRTEIIITTRRLIRFLHEMEICNKRHSQIMYGKTIHEDFNCNIYFLR
jgi:hypothetical protein